MGIACFRKKVKDYFPIFVLIVAFSNKYPISFIREGKMILSTLIIAAGCFWKVQAEFDKIPGVISTQVGYTGGNLAHPTYEQVCSGLTGHAEAVEIIYDTRQISLNELLDVFFQIHNPTTLNQQGADFGTQYRSTIFYRTEKEKQIALHKIQKLSEKHIFKHPIVTTVEKLDIFYPAEEYHQKYLEKASGCHCHAK